MMRFRLLCALLLCLIPLSLSRADVTGCVCATGSAEFQAEWTCSLCREAESMPADQPFFFVKDIDPLKPNRWLILPRVHVRELRQMTPAQHAAYWTAAVAKATELFGDKWGLAVNGLANRSQCHLHMHIGKLRDGVEADGAVVVDTPAQIPVEDDEYGLVVHKVNGKLHVHMHEEAGELLLEP